MAIAIQPVILCGGSGSRLWPLSRAAMPKPFIPLAGEEGLTLFQQTALRVQGQGVLPPVVICADAHRFYVLNQLQAIGITPAAVILEPAARNTAAAIALATLWAQGTTAPLAILPADHLMGSPQEFQSALHHAAQSADDNIVLFGITPGFANTEYGYIKLGGEVGAGARKVETFLEKPDRPAAEAMLQQGGHVWNSGMFTAAPALLESELATRAPAILQAVAAAWRDRATETLMGTQVIRPSAAFAQVPSAQFDTSVMEKTTRAVILPYTGRWSDIGSFASLAQALQQDSSGNSIATPATTQVLTPDTTGTLVHGTIPHKVIAVHGLSDAVVVDTPDGLLVTTKSRAAGVKNIFHMLQQAGAPQAGMHNRVYRPWGWSEVLCRGPQTEEGQTTGYLVKRISVIAGGRLSLQYHRHRAEHWTVVTGTATVTRGEEKLTLTQDQSAYLPLGIHHRLENQTDTLLEIIEVQTGPLLTEDDIVRLEDAYNRA